MPILQLCTITPTVPTANEPTPTHSPPRTAVQQARDIKHGSPLRRRRLRHLPPLARRHIPQVEQAVCVGAQAEAGAEAQQGGDDAGQGRSVLCPLGLPRRGEGGDMRWRLTLEQLECR